MAKNIQMLFIPNYLCASMIPTPLSQPPPIPVHTQHSLLRPLGVHPRLDGESHHHFMLLLGEDGHGGTGRYGHWGGECTLSLFGGGFHHKQFIIRDAETGREMGPQTTGQMDNPHPQQ